MAQLGLITIHGMGETKSTYANEFKKELASKLGKTVWDNVAFRSVYYQDILQTNQKAYYDRVDNGLDWHKLRKFVLFGFSDAASLESQKEGKSSPYYLAQAQILAELRALYKELPAGAPVVVLAQSLGGQVLSNYLWDALNKRKPGHGVWATPPAFSDKDEENFCRGKSIQLLVTTGCNIPIFVAGIHRKQIKPIKKPMKNFEWHNYYDADDVLGWPLQPLSDTYESLVEDHKINSGLTPLSHVKYWTDGSFLKPFASKLKDLLGVS